VIIDTHTRIWHTTDQLGPQVSAVYQQRYADPTQRLDASEQAHLEATEQIDVSFVLGLTNRRLGAEIPNTLISSFVQSRPDRLIGFGGIDPMADDWPDQLQHIKSLGLAGIVISPSEQGFHPGHTQAMLLYEQCQQMQLPIIVDQGNPFVVDSILSYADPALFDEPARNFPNLRLLIAHAGRPYVESTLALVGKHRHVYTDFAGLTQHSWALYDALIRAHDMGVTDRILFGSNFPHTAPHTAIQAIYSTIRFTQGTAWPNIPRQKLQSMIERDALHCLGLKRTAPSDGTPIAKIESAPSTPSRQEADS
jgi:predicted TIM-barrel fold metal-dependent hydrolase